MRRVVLAFPLLFLGCRASYPSDITSRGYAATTLVAYTTPYAMQSCLEYARDLDRRGRGTEADAARKHCDIDADLAGKSITLAFERWDKGLPFQGVTACHVTEAMDAILEMPHMDSADFVIRIASEQAMYARTWCSR